MARYIDVHPENPQARVVAQVAAILAAGGLVALPTDAGFAVACQLGNKEGLDRIRALLQAPVGHNVTLLCRDLADIGRYAEMDNDAFRMVRSHTPGPYTYILKASRETPRITWEPKVRSVGVRVPRHVTALALIEEVGSPLVCSSLILPGEVEPLTDGWQVKEELDTVVDAVLDSGDCGDGSTTVIDLTGKEPVVARIGIGDPTPFE